MWSSGVLYFLPWTTESNCISSGSHFMPRSGVNSSKSKRIPFLVFLSIPFPLLSFLLNWGYCRLAILFKKSWAQLLKTPQSPLSRTWLQKQGHNSGHTRPKRLFCLWSSKTISFWSMGALAHTKATQTEAHIAKGTAVSYRALVHCAVVMFSTTQNHRVMSRFCPQIPENHLFESTKEDITSRCGFC